MDIPSLWILALSVATPIAGVVGFSVQLRQVKKVRLENEKLQLEIMVLKETAASADKRIVKVTTDEVLKFSEPRLSRALEARISVGEEEEAYEVQHARPYKLSLKDALLNVAVFSALALLISYFVYDVYRLVIWVLTKW